MLGLCPLAAFDSPAALPGAEWAYFTVHLRSIAIAEPLTAAAPPFYRKSSTSF